MTTWEIQPVSAGEEPDERIQLKTTLSFDEYRRKTIGEYVDEAAGWVTPIRHGFLNLYRVQDPQGTESHGDLGEHIDTEFVEIASIPLRIDIRRKEWARENPTQKSGEQIRKHLRERRKSGARSHIVVWFQNKGPVMDPQSWLDACMKTVDGFVDERMPPLDQGWMAVSPWLQVIHTPWATFATHVSPDKENVFVPVLDARVRHLVVDAVLLAVANEAHVQQTIDAVATSWTWPDSASRIRFIDARDEFYQWRSVNWWERPAKGAIPNEIWRGVGNANNLSAQVDTLSREMADYAAVEESRHNRRIENYNVRLAWGAYYLLLWRLSFPLFTLSSVRCGRLL